MNNLNKEVNKRRTFAIISHPDAGKTTLTEKLLLYGGAIREAGTVKSRKSDKHAVSDWMEIEKQRGISVTSSVMQFNYKGNCINILDTPGHQDFSEDTYRTLMAADSAVMLIDGAKGVEPQTIKLFQVCRRRGIPIFTMVNKMDRASRDPLELMEEIENVLGIRTCPINWPIGTHGNFKGIYVRDNASIEVFDSGNHGRDTITSQTGDLMDEAFVDLVGEELHDQLIEEIDLLDIAGDEFDIDKVLDGKLSPLFFGSAINNFGVEHFLEEFLKLAPAPGHKETNTDTVSPTEENFSAFVFKIQANMNPAHRDRIAFMRICSGKFYGGIEVWHNGNKIRLTQPQQFMAKDRQVVTEAYAGDIIGIFDPGIFRIGDTLCENNKELRFSGIPLFPAELFQRVRPENSMKRKQFSKGINQLSEEGAIQVFKELDIGIEEYVIGAVGILQFDVLRHRLINEYKVDIKTDSLSSRFARWAKLPENMKSNDLNLTSTTRKCTDRFNNLILLFDNQWSIDWAIDNNEGIELFETSQME